MANPVDALASPERETAGLVSLKAAVSTLVLPVGVVALIAACAAIFDPAYTATPLISAQARGYYLAAFVILGFAIAVEVVRLGLAAPELATAVAGWSLVVGAATLVFAGHRSVAVFLIVAALAVVEARTREAQAASAQGRIARAGQVVAVALFWLTMFGLLEFHLRWLYAFPLAGAAGVLAYLRYIAADHHPGRADAATAAVLGLAALQMVAAVSFMNAGAATLATLITLALAGIYLVGQIEWRRSSR